MKKLLVFLIAFLFIPTICYASVLDEVPPYVNIIGINENDYNITKTIKNEEVVINLTEKATGLSYSWSFDKNKIKDKITLNFEIDFVSKNKEEIDRLAGDINKVYVSFSHHGDLPSDAKIKVDVSEKFSEGDSLYLYYYNEENGNIEFIDKNIKVKNGYAEFVINHCSEYFLTGAVVNDAVNNPQNLNYVIVGLVGLVVLLVGYTLFKKR